jgi:hypothetical protein
VGGRQHAQAGRVEEGHAVEIDGERGDAVGEGPVHDRTQRRGGGGVDLTGDGEQDAGGGPGHVDRDQV